MSEEQLNLPRKLFGVPQSTVELLLEERDRMLDLAERRVKAAEGRAAELESELLSRAKALAAVTERQAAEAQAPPQPEPQEPSTHPRALAEELSKVVTAAEESTDQIIQAWVATRDQIQQADRLWSDVHAEIVRFAAWREEVEPLIRQVQEAIVEARASIDDVPQRVEQALAPAADAMAVVGSGMNRFAQSTALPSGTSTAEDQPPEEADFQGAEQDETEPETEPEVEMETEPEVEMETEPEDPPPAADAEGSWPEDGVEMVPLPPLTPAPQENGHLGSALDEHDLTGSEIWGG